MLVSAEELRIIMPFAKTRIDTFTDPLNLAMENYTISSKQRIAMFLAQIAHESGEMRYVKELASGDDYDPLGPKPQLAVRLGNTEPGDGPKYKGRGLFQITGKSNYMVCGDALGFDLVAEPELLEQPTLAALSAGWFWDSRKLNSLADQENFRGVTKKINGGYNGYEERVKYWKRALVVFAERTDI